MSAENPRIEISQKEDGEKREPTPEEIIEMKERFRAERNLLPEMCADLVLGMLLESEAETKARREEAERCGGSFATNIEYETREDFAWHVGVLSASWSRSMQQAIDLPGSEWPEYMASPRDFIEGIKERDAQKAADELEPEISE